jgi:hypothetical protein
MVGSWFRAVELCTTGCTLIGPIDGNLRFAIRDNSLLPSSFDSCAYRKSNPAILMVQSAQDRAADDIPGPLNAAMDGGTRLVAAR